MKRLSKSMVVCIMAAVMVMSVGCDKEKWRIRNGYELNINGRYMANNGV